MRFWSTSVTISLVPSGLKTIWAALESSGSSNRASSWPVARSTSDRARGCD